MSAEDTDDGLSDETITSIDEAAERLAEASSSGSSTLRRIARWFTIIAVSAPVVIGIIAAGAAVYFGYITPDLTVSGTVDISKPLQYLVWYWVALAAVTTTSFLLIALPGSFISGITSAVARIADSYQMERE